MPIALVTASIAVIALSIKGLTLSYAQTGGMLAKAIGMAAGVKRSTAYLVLVTGITGCLGVLYLWFAYRYGALSVLVMYVLVGIKLGALAVEYLIVGGYFAFGKAYFWHDKVQSMVSLATAGWVAWHVGFEIVGR